MKRHAAPLVSVATAAGLLIGLRAITTLGPSTTPLLAIETVPRETFGIVWSSFAVWPAEAQVAAFDRLLGTVAALVLAAVAIATLNTVILLAEASATRRSELAVRSALGAGPLRLAAHLLRELRMLVGGGVALGMLLGVSAGAAARLTWPDALLPLSEPPADLVGALVGLLLVVAVAHLSGAWQTSRPGMLMGALRTGARATVDPSAIFVRNALAASHIALAATVMLAAVTLAGASTSTPPGRSAAGPNGAEPWAIDVTSPSESSADRGWGRTLAAIRAIPGMEAESLAAPGALVGLGIRDIALADCGACMRGVFPAPLWNTTAEHYVVAPGFFGLDDIEILEGRDFAAGDDMDSEPVAIVNRALAHSAFEGGRPIGRRIRIGSDVDGWYRVIGVVDARPLPGLGSEATMREQVFLSALQRPPQHGTILLDGDEEAVRQAGGALAAAGFAPSQPLPLSRYRAGMARPVAWSRGVALVAGLLALALGLAGIAEIAGQTTRRHSRELAVRAALGSPGWRLVAHVLAGRLRVTLWGTAGFVFTGSLVVALLEGAGVAGPGISRALAVGSAAGIAALVATARAAGSVTRVAPSTLLD